VKISIHIYHICSIVLRTKNVSGKAVEKTKPHILYTITLFSESRRL